MSHEKKIYNRLDYTGEALEQPFYIFYVQFKYFKLCDSVFNWISV